MVGISTHLCAKKKKYIYIFKEKNLKKKSLESETFRGNWEVSFQEDVFSKHSERLEQSKLLSSSNKGCRILSTS